MSENQKPLLIVIVGPTAVGKTSTSIALANEFKAEIVSADSRQFYREMEIGTAKPTKEELALAKHHLVNNLSIQDEYSVGQFEKDALGVIAKLFIDDKIAIMVGGSGLFVDAVCNGLDDFPDIDPNFRIQLNSLYKSKGILPLQVELEEHDPEYYEIVDRQNPQRLIRALEVIRATGNTFTSFRKRKKVERPFHVLKIGLEMDREQVYQRIDQRMDQMIDAGLFEEAERLYPYKELNALQTVGYQEVFAYLDDQYDKDEAVRLLKRNSRRYAKRQMTWFKRDESTHWFNPDQLDKMVLLIRGQLESLEPKN